jgi:putative endonuclease
MPGSRSYSVYIVTSRSRTLYVGVTDNIKRRIREHKQGDIEGFTRRYHLDSLVYFEVFGDVYAAIAREKQIKRWRREKNLRLIIRENPDRDWHDLSDGWYE